MATTKVREELVDFNPGNPDYILDSTNVVTVINAGGNQYNFNGVYGKFGAKIGTITLTGVPSSHPFALINNGKTSQISYTGSVNEGTAAGPDGNTYTFYSGTVTLTVSADFGTISYYCKIHGYMGGQDNLVYTYSESGLKIPTGTNNNRPATDVAGMVRNNTNEASEGSASCEEYYNGAAWKKINVAPLPILMDFLVVAGGGGGANGGGGGGGAGGLRTSFGSTSGGGSSAESTLNLSASTTYTVTIGAGGNRGTGANVDQGDDGNDSVFGSITSTAGGGGGRYNLVGSPGGSGGGAGGNSTASFFSSYGTPTQQSGGSGASGQGFAGGAVTSTASGNSCPTAGGGGAGAVGGNALGNGGAALAVSITGSSVTYAGGGGGGNGNAGSSGGSGGGAGAGNGAAGSNQSYPYATANTGSGGGAGGVFVGAGSYEGGNGGSGIVILRIATSNYSGTTTGSPTVTTDGSDTILTYTGSGTYVQN